MSVGVPPTRSPDGQRRGYLPLFVRIVLANAVVLLAACFAIFVVLSHTRISEVATDEVLLFTLCVVTLGNIFMVRRLVAPLQKLTARAREVDPASPGARFPCTGDRSEAGELAAAFNEMLERLEHERAESARSVLAAHESERLRVAQELHDEVGQTLTAVLLQLSRMHGETQEQLRHELDEAQDAVRSSLDDVRRIATELRPETLADLGLASALTTLADTFARRTGIDVGQEIEANLPALSGNAELALYRVAQEALTNAVRHSGSARVDIALSDGAGQLTLRVRDYGHGLGAVRPLDGNGMRGMRERASAVGARLRVGRPAAGHGSEVMLELPLARQAPT